jgi:hypothetical protein
MVVERGGSHGEEPSKKEKVYRSKDEQDHSQGKGD